MPNVTNIKSQIGTYLQDLVTAGTIGEYQIDDFQSGIFDRDYGAYPVAVLTSPATESRVYTNVEVYRTYIFEIVVICRGEDITSSTQIETLQEAILDKFDNNITLNGYSQETEAAASTPQSIMSRSRTWIAFSVTLRAKALKART
jgi:hypothetical protein